MSPGSQISLGLTSVNPTGGTSVSASNDGDTITLETWPVFDFPAFLYNKDVPYEATKLDPWTLEALNGADTSTFMTPDRTGAPEMPFVRKLSIDRDQNTADVYWEAPNTNARIDRYQVQLWNADTRKIIRFDSPISSSARQYTFTGLDPQSNYEVRISPEQTETASDLTVGLEGIVTRSSNWDTIHAGAPSGSGNVANLVTGSPANLQQIFDTPNDIFTLSFDYAFETTTGELTVEIDGQEIGVPLLASASGGGFRTALFEIDNPALLGLNSALLDFELNGPTGSSVLLDNISYPGLVNGDFEAGTSGWQFAGDGTVVIRQIPTPSALALFGLGLLALAAGWRASHITQMP